ncbi:uncharacterized protein LOC126265290 isoform X1 [Aethina tumida]|uniref:uncharacterized protein LOC126265290 isoform X1 n=1 Tax=Aethina tumida TaxID=116153 RepID=UPI002147AAC3|nr:uncharacterized protein LOC126265290 isoform X1 [Aethina tumida]
MQHFVVGTSQLNMNVFLNILLLFDLVFNCEFCMKNNFERGRVHRFVGNDTDTVKNVPLNTSVTCQRDIPVKLHSNELRLVKKSDMMKNIFYEYNISENYYIINETRQFTFFMYPQKCIWFAVYLCDKCDINVSYEYRIFDYFQMKCQNSRIHVFNYCTTYNGWQFFLSTRYFGTKFGLRFWHLSEIYAYSPVKYCGNNITHDMELDDLVSTSKILFNSKKLENKCKQNCIICFHGNCSEHRAPQCNYEYLYILILIPIIFFIIVVFYCLTQKCKMKLDSEIYYKFFRKNNSTNNDEQHLYEYVRHDNENDEDGYLKALTKDATDEESENSGKYYKFFRKNDSANNDRPHLYDYIRRHNENDEDGFESVNEVYKG